MAATFQVHNSAGTPLGILSPSRATWRHQAGEDGAGSLTVAGDVDAAMLAEAAIIRVAVTDGTVAGYNDGEYNDGEYNDDESAADRFAFVPTRKVRRQVESSTELDLSGPGVRWLLHAGQVLQEDTSDCAEPASTRWFGWMSDAYDSSSWSKIASHGTFASDPWESVRPQGWPDPTAEYLWSTTKPAAAGDVYFRRTFSTTEETDVIVCAAADDEYRLFLDGTEILSTWGGGALQWERYQKRPMRICPGNHTLAIVGRNLDRPVTSTNYAWIIATILPVDVNGDPLEQNQKYNVYHDASSGTFTLSVSSEATGNIAYDASTATITSALEALSTVGSGNVSVTGSNTLRNTKYTVDHDHTGGTFTLTARGGTTAAIAYNATAAQVEAAMEAVIEIGDNVTVTGAGSSADPWVIEFDNDLTLTDVTMTGDGSSLTGGTAFTVTKTQTGTNDPWVVEFISAKANIYVLLEGDGTGLTGGTLEIDEVQRGMSGHPLVRTDLTASWKCLAYPATAPGLSPGEVLRIAMEEAQARGTTVLDDFTLGFTDSADSDGTTWSSNLTLPITLPSDVHRLAVLVEELGFPVEVTPDLTLECWDSRGTDLSATISLTAGTAGMSNFVADRDETAVTNVIRAFTDEGWVEDTNATSITARGRWESGISLEGFPTEIDATAVTDPMLDEYATPPRTTAVDVASEAAVVPYADFGMADIVSASAFGTSGFDTVDMRVVSIAGRVEESSIVWTVEMVD